MKTILTLCLYLLLFRGAFANLLVTGGYLVVHNSSLNVAGTLTVEDSAVLKLSSNYFDQLEAVIIAGSVHIMPGGSMIGCGKIHADVLNDGMVLADCGNGTRISLDGTVVNNGEIHVLHGSEYTTGQNDFINIGLLDLISSPSPIPSNLTGNGSVVTSSTLPQICISILPDKTVILNYQKYAGHKYRVEKSDSLSGNWTPIFISSEQEITTGQKIIKLSGEANSMQMFYRYIVDPESENQTRP